MGAHPPPCAPSSGPTDGSSEMKSEQGVKTFGDSCIQLGKGGFKLLFFPKPAIQSKVPVIKTTVQSVPPGPGHRRDPPQANIGARPSGTGNVLHGFSCSPTYCLDVAQTGSARTPASERRYRARGQWEPHFPNYCLMPKGEGYTHTDFG